METTNKLKRIFNLSWKIGAILTGIFVVIVVGVYVFALFHNNFGRDGQNRYLSETITVHRSPNHRSCRVYNTDLEEYVTPRLEWVQTTDIHDSLTVFRDKNGKCGFLDIHTGKIVIPAKYEFAWPFSEGLAAVVENTGDKMGFINLQQDLVIAPQFDFYPPDDYCFREGVCILESKNGKKGMIDREGKWILEQDYDCITYEWWMDGFIVSHYGSKGLLENGTFKWKYPLGYNDIYWCSSESGSGLILYRDFRAQMVDRYGDVIEQFVIDETKPLEYPDGINAEGESKIATSDKVIKFRVKELWGVMDKKTGKVIIEAMYPDVSMTSENLILCQKGNDEVQDNIMYNLNGSKIAHKL